MFCCILASRMRTNTSTRSHIEIVDSTRESKDRLISFVSTSGSVPYVCVCVFFLIFAHLLSRLTHYVFLDRIASKMILYPLSWVILELAVASISCIRSLSLHFSSAFIMSMCLLVDAHSYSWAHIVCGNLRLCARVHLYSYVHAYRRMRGCVRQKFTLYFHL